MPSCHTNLNLFSTLKDFHDNKTECLAVHTNGKEIVLCNFNNLFEYATELQQSLGVGLSLTGAAAATEPHGWDFSRWGGSFTYCA